MALTPNPLTFKPFSPLPLSPKRDGSIEKHLDQCKPAAVVVMAIGRNANDTLGLLLRKYRYTYYETNC